MAVACFNFSIAKFASPSLLSKSAFAKPAAFSTATFLPALKLIAVSKRLRASAVLPSNNSIWPTPAVNNALLLLAANVFRYNAFAPAISLLSLSAIIVCPNQ